MGEEREPVAGMGDWSSSEWTELLSDFAKRWLAHDGLWFQAVEAKFGMEAAIELDALAWQRFTELEAGRIRRILNLPADGGLDALAQALQLRLYAFVNEQEIIRPDDHTLIFRMNRCRVQDARERKGMAAFPCKSVGEVEYSGFARTIDPRIQTRVLTCPPDPHPAEYHCAWEFTLKAGESGEAGAASKSHNPD